jgi:hypothetical protein
MASAGVEPAASAPEASGSGSASHPMDGLEFGFSASGWLMSYQLGVAYALQRHGVSLSTARFVGASGGSAVSAALALNLDCKVINDFMVRCCADFHANPLSHIWRMGDYAKNCIERTMVEHTFRHTGLAGAKKLNVAVTLLPSLKGVILSDFRSNQEYLDALMASCCLAPIAGMPFRIQRPGCAAGAHDQWVIDGGLAQMVPRLSAQTITVCPLYCFEADVRPSRYVPLHWGVYPPAPNDFEELFWLGARDGMAFLERRGLAHARLPGDVFRAHMGRDWTGTIRERPSRAPVSAHASAPQQQAVFFPNPRAFEVQSRAVAAPPARSRAGSADSSLSEGSLASASLQRRAGEPLSALAAAMHRFGDGVTVGVLLVTVKPLALGVVYAELASMAALSTAAGVLAAIETARRGRVEQSKGVLSLRKWVHDGMVGTAQEQLLKAKSYLAAVADPALWRAALASEPTKTGASASQHAAVNETLKSHSIAYRLFVRASVF